MIWDNWAYTKRKQKEMAEKSNSFQNDSYKYTEFSKPQRTSTQWQKEKLKQRRMKIYTTIMLTLMCCVYTTIIAYFWIYGV